VNIPLIHQKHKGYTASFKVKLFYTSNMSVILQSMIVSQFYVISSILSARFSKSILVKIFGVWENGRVTNGFMWYISPPQDFNDMFTYPIRAFTYILFVCVSCAMFSR
jgi:protein transport protein SEC61 subunit alpha